MFFCEQMFLTKLGNEHTCESAIYTYQNAKLIQRKCNIEYYPNLDPEPELLNAGNYLLLGNFPLPWNYFCSKIDEIPKPIHGSNYVILKKTDLVSMFIDCRVMVHRGKHCLLYSRTSYHVKFILYCQHGNYSISVGRKVKD